jgi:Ran GTPase-activating protein (RanGAP) involved in mRNA processing and transport
MTITLTHALELLKQNNITSLDLGLNQIGAKGAIALAKVLEHNTTLKTLILWNNQIGDEGAKLIAEYLKGNTTLTELNLGGNQIGNKGVEEIKEFLKSSTSIITIELSDNSAMVYDKRFAQQDDISNHNQQANETEPLGVILFEPGDEA